MNHSHNVPPALAIWYASILKAGQAKPINPGVEFKKVVSGSIEDLQTLKTDTTGQPKLLTSLDNILDMVF